MPEEMYQKLIGSPSCRSDRVRRRDMVIALLRIGDEFNATSTCPSRIGLPSPSGQLAKGTQAAEQAAVPARMVQLRRVGAEPAPGMLHPLALGGPRRPLLEDACDVAGAGDALDRCHQEMSSDPAKSVHEGGGITDESGRNLDNEALHLKSLQLD